LGTEGIAVNQGGKEELILTDKLTRATDDNRVSELLGFSGVVNDQDTLTAEAENGLSASFVESIWELTHSQPMNRPATERA